MYGGVWARSRIGLVENVCPVTESRFPNEMLMEAKSAVSEGLEVTEGSASVNMAGCLSLAIAKSESPTDKVANQPAASN